MLKLYRIAKSKFARDLSGAGAYYVGGRWNSAGRHVLYSSGSVSLSILEVLVHFTSDTCPSDMCLIEIGIPESSVKEVSVRDLPVGWKDLPFSNEAQKVGNDWLSRQESLVLKVPSVINEFEFNYLINPNHHLFSKVEILNVRGWYFDARLGIK